MSGIALAPKSLQRPPRLAVALALAAAGSCAHALPVFGQGTWETTLQARDLNGDGIADAYYDTVLDLTWLADWGAGGAMARDDAVAWAAGLGLFGVTGWQLPASDTEVDACDYRTGCGSALAHLFYVTLGNLGSTDADGNPRGGDAGLDWGLVNTAGFANMQADSYLALPFYPPNPCSSTGFSFYDGSQSCADELPSLLAVAVHPGDVASVPEPHTLPLLLAGFAAAALARWRTVPVRRPAG